MNTLPPPNGGASPRGEALLFTANFLFVILNEAKNFFQEFTDEIPRYTGNEIRAS